MEIYIDMMCFYGVRLLFVLLCISIVWGVPLGKKCITRITNSQYHTDSQLSEGQMFKGSPFPLPKLFLEDQSIDRQLALFLLDAEVNIAITSINSNYSSRIVELAVDRWCNRLQKMSFPNISSLKTSFIYKDIAITIGRIPSLSSECSSHLCRKSYNESSNKEAYQIKIGKESGTIQIFAGGSRGCIHALSYLNQLLFVPVSGRGLTIMDWPDKRWRGLMLDLSRHFIPPKLLLNTIDAMEISRLNILHLHLTDSQSFPLQLDDIILSNGSILELSLLAKRGAFDATKTYSRQDLEGIVQYAMDRGIEVIPELDMPAHALSWGHAFADVIVPCHRLARSQQTPHNIYPLDPSNPMTFLIAEEILKQIVSVFPSKYLHIGGDEVNEQCWQESEQLQKWAKNQNISSHKITKYFEEQIFKIVINKLKKVPIVWQGILDAGNIPEEVFSDKHSLPAQTYNTRGRMLRSISEYDNEEEALLLFPTKGQDETFSKVIIEPWKCWGGLAVRAAATAANLGYPVWMAACHYLDYNSDWTTFLMTDQLSKVDISPKLTENPVRLMLPADSNAARFSSPSSPSKSNQPNQPLRHEDYFLGGEGAMWTECVDHTNFECRVWPRAGAIAQSLWGFYPNDCESLSLRNCNGTESLGNGVYQKSDAVTLSLPFTQFLYAGYAHFRYYLWTILKVSASPLIFHYLDRVSNGPSNTVGGSGSFGGRRSASSFNYYSSSNIHPIYPRNLSRALQMIDSLEAGITVTSSGPRIIASLPATSTHRNGHQMWMSSQCLGIPEAVQRPLNTPGFSLVQLNIADGSIGARGDQMLTWLQEKASQGVQVVGFCELVGWNSLHSKTELVKNVPQLTLRGANAGFVYSYVTKPSTTNAYPVGLVSALPFDLIQEYHAPFLQRCAVHVYLPKLQLHVFVVHLHAHDATLRSKEARFLVQQMQDLLDKKEKVVIMGDLNTLSPYDRLHHEEEQILSMLHRTDNPVFPRLKKKFLTTDGEHIDYRTIQHFLNAGLRDVCVEYCCQQQAMAKKLDTSSRSNKQGTICPRVFISVPMEDDIPNSNSFAPAALTAYEKEGLPEWSYQSNYKRNSSSSLRKDKIDRGFAACMRRHCAGSEPTKYNPEWPNVGIDHPRIRLDYIFMNDAALGRSEQGVSHVSSILAAGIEVNNVTELLSDHFPAFVQWSDPASFPNGIDLFGL